MIATTEREDNGQERKIYFKKMSKGQGSSSLCVPFSFFFCPLCSMSFLDLRLLWLRVMVFNATFSNMSATSLRSVLLETETGVPRENHPPVASH
jgi:hypothetical protein